jgi:hypothetical protein
MNTHRLQSRRGVFGGYGGALAVAVLALGFAACTRTMSLGAAGTPDGSDVRASTDAGDAPVDLPVDSAPDAATDTPADRNTDATSVTCIDNGITYHVGDVIPRGAGSCPMSCLCLGNGSIGNCTGVSCPDASTIDAGQNCVDNGITYHSGDVVLCPGHPLSCICTDGTVGNCGSGIPCPVDGSIVIDPIPVASITRGATTPPGVEVSIDSLGAAQRSVASPSPLPMPPLPRTFPPGAPEVTLFLYHLQRVGDITRLTVACPDAVVNAITVRRLSGTSVTSSNLDCPLINPTPDAVAFVHDVQVLLGIDDGNDSINAQACTTTGGQIQNNLCCTGASNFPDSCGVGACSCSPANLKVVDSCVCPSGACFLQSAGCVGPANVCTVGADQTCNDNPGANAFHGTCVTGGHCLCHTGFMIVTASGKCS